MTWTAPDLSGVTTLDELKKRLAERLPKLYRTARAAEGVVTLPFTATVRPSGDTTRAQLIPITEAIDFTVVNPTDPREGVFLTLDFWNTSGEDMGIVTFGSDFKLAGPFEAPGDGLHGLYTFVWVPA